MSVTALTRAPVEGVLIRRAGTILRAVGLDGTTQNGTNADLNDPIRRALRTLGCDSADPINVVDADLAPVTGWQVEKLLDAAELRLLESIWGNWAEVSQRISQGENEFQQLADRIQTRIECLEERLRKPYGPNVGAAAVGRIDHGRHIPYDRPLMPPGGFPIGGGDWLWW